MRVHIVCYEDVDRWILGKFALKLHENLQKMGIESDISKEADPAADINHHIIYYDFNGIKSSIDTLMITHIDNINKLNQLKIYLNTAEAGICMSRETQMYLTKMGVDKNKLCYVNPAHDGKIAVKKTVIGITSRVQEDGRKREFFLDKLAKRLNNQYFKFKIMGDGWEEQVKNLQKHDFEVDYIDHFDYEEYIKLIPAFDYYLYMGMDEGQMGFIDALAAGVKTIVTAQGYHLDAPGGITHPYTSYDELESILLSIQKAKEILIDSVATWNWFDYTRKHMEIWEYLIDNKKRHSNFQDGLNSLLNFNDSSIDTNYINKKNKFLKRNIILQNSYRRRKRVISIYKSRGIIGLLQWLKDKVLLIQNDHK
jgi:hypothetical protein